MSAEADFDPGPAVAATGAERGPPLLRCNCWTATSAVVRIAASQSRLIVDADRSTVEASEPVFAAAAGAAAGMRFVGVASAANGEGLEANGANARRDVALKVSGGRDAVVDVVGVEAVCGGGTDAECGEGRLNVDDSGDG